MVRTQFDSFTAARDIGHNGDLNGLLLRGTMEQRGFDRYSLIGDNGVGGVEIPKMNGN